MTKQNTDEILDRHKDNFSFQKDMLDYMEKIRETDRSEKLDKIMNKIDICKDECSDKAFKKIKQLKILYEKLTKNYDEERKLYWEYKAKIIEDYRDINQENKNH